MEYAPNPPPRQKIYAEIDTERDYQEQRWGSAFDNKNTCNDWVCYIAAYVGKAYTLPFDAKIYRKMLVKVAAIAVAAIESFDRLDGKIARRHFD